MGELTTEQEGYLSDDMYTPIYYLRHGMTERPRYKGKGNHSILQLEAICKQFEDYVHEQNIIKQNAMKYVVELKFNINLPNTPIEKDEII